MPTAWSDPPEAALRRVTLEIGRRAVRLGRRHGRTIGAVEAGR